MISEHSPSRQAGNALIVAQAQSQVQTLLDELKNGTRNYRTVASLDAQIAQAYRGRCILELLQNAHDVLAHAGPDDPRRVSFVLCTGSEPALLIGNSGRPFLTEDFKGICQLAQSPKNPNESIGNKGLGFRSVLEVSSSPEIWSTAPAGSDTSFVFRFAPDVADRVAAAVRELQHKGLDVRSPFDPDRPLVDWSQEQLDKYRERVSKAESDDSWEATKFLSPYQIPLPIEGLPPEVEGLLSAGHVTVVRLPLDGGKTGSCDEAVQSVRDQLDKKKLDAQSTVFLHHLESLVIDIDGERRTLERVVDSNVDLSGCPRTSRQRLRIKSSVGTPEDITRDFLLWTRIVGGNSDPEQAERIRRVVEHLPNRWPEVRQMSVGVAVADAPDPDEGLFVIFLPTHVTTGSGAHINAPFYGSLDRRQIDFEERYNDLLLDNVVDLCIDAAGELVAGQPQGWRGRAVVDLLSSTATIGGEKWWLIDKLRERASARDNALNTQALVLCDNGWHLPGDARVMPNRQGDNPISVARWREHSAFAVVSTELAGRRHAVKELLTDLGGSPDPTHGEWRTTIERMALQVDCSNVDVTWDAFLNSVISVLPEDMKAEPRVGTGDPLADARFLPTQDGRLLSTADSAKLFFQPRGADDAAGPVGDVPSFLKGHVAFLHPDVQTQEGPHRRNTTVEKFLDGRFAQRYRREDLLRSVIIRARPRLPVSYGSPEAERCSEIFAWTLKLLGDDESRTLLPLLRHLPVACHGGWRPMSEAVFGSGWSNRLGDSVELLADELPAEAAERLRRTALLAPDDPRWGVAVEDRNELFARAGVVDGLRLHTPPDITFWMPGWGPQQLPREPPLATPQTAWEDWRNAVREDAEPPFSGGLQYSLSGVRLLPEIHHLAGLSPRGRKALSELVLASFANWQSGWEAATIKKLRGSTWEKPITSPLKYWLETEGWLSDQSSGEYTLGHRWLVPESLLRGQRDRYGYLDPLSLDLARRLSVEKGLKYTLVQLGLNVYPTDDDRTGPELLDALATAWTADRVPAGRFDVFLGQLRDAWGHLDQHKGLPSTFLIRRGRRRFSTCGPNELAEVYLPDDRDRTRSLREREMPILEMHPSDANRLADTLALTRIKKASKLAERFLIDGDPWSEAVDAIPVLDETDFATWLPVTLLTVAAHGGAATGAVTESWRQGAETLRRTRVLKCADISVELVDGHHVVASNEPDTQWLPGDVLAIRRDRLSYEALAPATQALLGRQDLLKDLRLVLGSLNGQETPTWHQIEGALERAEIDAQSLADVCDRWMGGSGIVVDRIRPLLVLFEISDDGLDAVATDMERLKEWLSLNFHEWPAPDVLATARRSRDDGEMGEAAWRFLGDTAQLPEWNEALAKLGEGYEAVENHRAAAQTEAHLEDALPLLRGLARYVALESDSPDLFHKIEQVNQNVKAGADWSTRWWEVPFGAVLDALRIAYAEIPDVGCHLDLIEDARTLDDLRTAFQQRGIATDPNPYETASLNQNRLNAMLAGVQDLHRTWVELRTSEVTLSEHSEVQARLDATAYLREWIEAELFDRALATIDDAEFVNACNGCGSLEAIRQRLGLTPKDIDTERLAGHQRQQEAERRRRTFDVAGAPFEVGTTSYRTLFERLERLAHPKGPRASKDEFTPLVKPGESGGTTGGRRGTKRKTPQPRPSADLRDLVGVVGEMQAYRFLRAEFGNDVVTRDAWVSEIRLSVLPPVEAEPHDSSDSHGFDFRFSHHRKKWHVEVKATAGDDPQFELGISEIKAANHFARARGGRWRILRVSNTLSDRPEFDWLPNPFEDGFTEHFRLQKGGMIVSYRRRKA